MTAAAGKPAPPFVPVRTTVTVALRDDGRRQKTLKLGQHLVAYIGDDVEPTPDAIGRIVDAWAARPYGSGELPPRECSKAVNGGGR